MAYTTFTKVRAYLTGISTSDVGDVEITTIIADRSDPWVDDELGTLYSVPFSGSVPKTVERLSTVVAAAWTLFTAYNKSGAHWGAVAGFWKALWDHAEATVEKIRAGKIVVVGATEKDSDLMQHNIPADAEAVVHATDEEDWRDDLATVSDSDVSLGSEEED
jgi:hypothetical protein